MWYTLGMEDAGNQQFGQMPEGDIYEYYQQVGGGGLSPDFSFFGQKYAEYTERIRNQEDFKKRQVEAVRQNPEAMILSRTTSPDIVRETVRDALRWTIETREKNPSMSSPYPLMQLLGVVEGRVRSLELGRDKKKLRELEESGVDISFTYVELPPKIRILPVPKEHQIYEELDRMWENGATEEQVAQKEKELRAENEQIRRQIEKIEDHNRAEMEKKRKWESKQEELEETREPLIEALRQSVDEALLRMKVEDMWKIYRTNAGSAEKMAEIFLYPVDGMMTAEDLEKLFNLPDFGHKIDKAMRLFYVIGNCAKKEKMIALMDTPGFKKLFPEGENDPLFRGFIGDPSGWVEDNERTEETYKEEERGLLTKHNNIFSRKENVEAKRELYENIAKFIDLMALRESGGFEGKSFEEIKEVIQNFETHKETVDAMKTGMKLFKMFGLAARAGGEKYSNGKIELEGFPETDELATLMNFALWQKKQDGSKFDCGNEVRIGKADRAITCFMGMLNEGEGQHKRTFLEKWWGYKEDNLGPREDAIDLGDMRWLEQDENIMRGWFLRVFFAGRKDGFVDVWKERKYDDITMFGDPAFIKGLNKLWAILINENLVAHGHFRNKVLEKGDDYMERKVKWLKYHLASVWFEGVKKGDISEYLFRGRGKHVEIGNNFKLRGMPLNGTGDRDPILTALKDYGFFNSEKQPNDPDKKRSQRDSREKRFGIF